jgi:hypothetical protein
MRLATDLGRFVCTPLYRPVSGAVSYYAGKIRDDNLAELSSKIDFQSLRSPGVELNGHVPRQFIRSHLECNEPNILTCRALKSIQKWPSYRRKPGSQTF